MRDEETESLWDHITGECFEGPLEGRRLDFWYVQLTNVGAERRKHPNTVLLTSSHRSLKSGFMKAMLGKRMSYSKEGTILAPHFRSSMHKEIDPRLPEGTQGLGLMDDLDRGKFYPVNLIPIGGEIEDEWLGRELRIVRDAIDGVPFATWVDNEEAPMQLLSRWYGFSFTYPGCEIYTGSQVDLQETPASLTTSGEKI